MWRSVTASCDRWYVCCGVLLRVSINHQFVILSIIPKLEGIWRVEWGRRGMGRLRWLVCQEQRHDAAFDLRKQINVSIRSLSTFMCILKIAHFSLLTTVICGGCSAAEVHVDVSQSFTTQQYCDIFVVEPNPCAGSVWFKLLVEARNCDAFSYHCTVAGMTNVFDAFVCL